MGRKGNKEKRKQGKPQEGDALGGPCCPALLTQGSCYPTWIPGFEFSMSLEHCRAARDASWACAQAVGNARLLEVVGRKKNVFMLVRGRVFSCVFLEGGELLGVCVFLQMNFWLISFSTFFFFCFWGGERETKRGNVLLPALRTIIVSRNKDLTSWWKSEAQNLCCQSLFF